MAPHAYTYNIQNPKKSNQLIQTQPHQAQAQAQAESGQDHHKRGYIRDS